MHSTFPTFARFGISAPTDGAPSVSNAANVDAADSDVRARLDALIPSGAAKRCEVQSDERCQVEVAHKLQTATTSADKVRPHSL